MRKNILKYISVVFCAVGLMSLSSCEDKYYTNVTEVIEKPTKVLTDTYEVRKGDWKWNVEMKRYEARMDGIPVIDDVYESGIVLGTVFVAEDDFPEVQKNMPFVHSFLKEDGTSFTEIISYDSYSDDLGMGITFYIQPSDLLQASAFVDDYTFKMTFVWGDLSEN